MHRACTHSVQIMKVEITASKCPQPRPQSSSSRTPKIKFPLPHPVLRHQHKPRFTTKGPNTFF